MCEKSPRLHLRFLRELILREESAPACVLRLLVREVRRLARDPFEAENFRAVVNRFHNFNLAQFFNKLRLNALERVILASSFISAQIKDQSTLTQAIKIIRNDFDAAFPRLLTSHKPPFRLRPTQLTKLMLRLLGAVTTGGPVLSASQRQDIFKSALPTMWSVLQVDSLPFSDNY